MINGFARCSYWRRRWYGLFCRLIRSHQHCPHWIFAMNVNEGLLIFWLCVYVKVCLVSRLASLCVQIIHLYHLFLKIGKWANLVRFVFGAIHRGGSRAARCLSVACLCEFELVIIFVKGQVNWSIWFLLDLGWILVDNMCLGWRWSRQLMNWNQDEHMITELGRSDCGDYWLLELLWWLRGWDVRWASLLVICCRKGQRFGCQIRRSLLVVYGELFHFPTSYQA